MSRTATPPLVLAFAASDPTGGAGLQADILTLAARGCHPLSVVTGMTVQDTRGVQRLVPVDAALVEAQALALLAELPVAAFKLGVLASGPNATAIARILGAHREIPVVVDPVLASGRGDTLADDNLVETLRAEILPRATVLTPNSLEARRLAGVEALHEAPARLAELGCRHVLVTGTHEETDEVENVLYEGSREIRRDRWPRLPGSYHGSGCTLASALAAALARGMPLAEAAYDAQHYTWQALERGFRPAQGQFLPRR